MIRHTVSRIGIGKFLLLWVFTLFFGLSGRTGKESTLLLHILALLNDQYYFTFAVLPIFLFICASAMEDGPAFEIMRYGRYSKYFFAKWRALALAAAGLWLGQMVTAACSGLGLSLDNGWEGIAHSVAYDVLEIVRAHFPSPGMALFCCAAQLLAGYLLIAVTALWLGHFCTRSQGVKLLMALYVLAILWIKLPAMSGPPLVYWTGINHWIFLLHNLTEPWRPFLTAAVTFLVLTGVVWSVSRNWRWTVRLPSHTGKGLFPYYRRLLFSKGNLLLLVGTLLLMTAWFWLQAGAPDSSADWTTRLFAGHGVGTFYPMGLLGLLVLDLIPLWPLGALGTQTANERSAFPAIRLKRRRELVGALLRVSVCWILFYGFLLVCAACLPALFMDLSPDWKLIGAAVGIKLLDVWLQFSLLLTALCLTGQAVIGFVAVVALHILCVLPIPWLLVGLSSLARLNLGLAGGTIMPLSAAVLLAALSTVLWFWIYTKGAKLLFYR